MKYNKDYKVKRDREREREKVTYLILNIELDEILKIPSIFEVKFLLLLL